MENTSWQQLKDLFFEAVEMPPAERATWLAQLEDPQLRDELSRLLADDAEALSLLDASPDDLAQLVDAFASSEVIEQVGPYRIVRELGRGGMGTVYLAERDDGAFQQQVALKVIRPGLDTADLIRRFEQERQILASLNHPHIARLFDGGTSAAGSPYFAMEWIDGAPITTYCDAHQLSVDERLRLFGEACAAVQYAHQNLIIHRDLKPSNMLVTPEGHLKLLDFGIAKLLASDQPDPLKTQTGLRVMTPAYASPEQLQGAPISTASDVYTLGVVLYELLAGRRPYEVTSEQEASVRMSTPPARPSTVVTEVSDREAFSKARSTSLERLQRKLAGDLDTIVLKALRPEPERRYASAEAFLDDIQRHLEGLPVRARKDTVGYRMRKFVRRHRVGVLAAALVMLSLLGGLSAALWQARAKSLEATRAEAVKAFVLDLFAQADPEVAQGEVLTARDLASQGAARVRETLNDQPEIQAEMLVVLAEVYRKLGEYDEALSLLEDALALRRARYGAEHEQTAEVLDRLGLVQTDRGNYDGADSLLTEALRIRQARLGDEHNDVAESIYNLAALKGASRQDRPDEATALHRQALEIRQRILDEDDPDLLRAMHGLAVTLSNQADYEAAAALFRDLLQRQRRALGKRHPETLRTISALANVLGHLQQYDEAIALGREVVALRKQVLGETHPDVAESITVLAVVLHNRQRKEDLDEAADLYREALSIRRATLGDDHPVIANSLASLALTLLAFGRPEEAIIPAREALALHLRTLGEEHRRIAIDKLFLAKILYGSEVYAEAERMFVEARDQARRSWPPDHLIFADLLLHHGQMLQEQGRIAEAEPMLTEGLRITEAQPEPPLSLLAIGKLRLGLCYTDRQQYEAAEPLLLDALSHYKEIEDGEGVALVHAGLAKLYVAWGKPNRAAPYR